MQHAGFPGDVHEIAEKGMELILLTHGGRITADEMVLIAALVVPLLFLVALVLSKALRVTSARRSSQDDDGGHDGS